MLAISVTKRHTFYVKRRVIQCTLLVSKYTLFGQTNIHVELFHDTVEVDALS